MSLRWISIHIHIHVHISLMCFTFQMPKQMNCSHPTFSPVVPPANLFVGTMLCFTCCHKYVGEIWMCHTNNVFKLGIHADRYQKRWMQLIPYRYHPCQLWAQHRFLAGSPAWARCRPALESESVSVGGRIVKNRTPVHQLWTKSLLGVTHCNTCSQSTDWHTPHGAATVHLGWYQGGWRSPPGWGWAPWPAPPGHLAPSAGSPSDPLAAQAASQPGTHPPTKSQGSLQKSTGSHTPKKTCWANRTAWLQHFLCSRVHIFWFATSWCNVTFLQAAVVISPWINQWLHSQFSIIYDIWLLSFIKQQCLHILNIFRLPPWPLWYWTKISSYRTK